MNYDPDEPAAPADVVREIEALGSRCRPILRDATTEGRTIESAAFVACLKEFSDALIDFGCEISQPAARAAVLLDVPPPPFRLAGKCEPLPPHQLLTKMMLRLLQRVLDESSRYASEVGLPDEGERLWRLSAVAVISGASVGHAYRLLIVWNSQRVGRSHADIAGQLGISLDRVPQMIAAAEDYLVSGSPKSPPADPS